MRFSNSLPVDKQASRRDFLVTSVVSTAALTLTSGVYANCAEPAQEKLNLAIIGVGGRGGSNLGGVAGTENIHTLCDINPKVLEGAVKKYPQAKVVTDWRKIMDDKAVDGVVISTADHHHALAAIAAMQADKHVYCEKPLAHTVYEARMVQNEYNKRKDKIATQMGTQIHATNNYRRVVELVQAGAVGPVKEAHVWCSRTINPVDEAVLPTQSIPDGFDWDSWVGPASMREYNNGYWQGGNLNWNRRWDFGNGVLGDMGSHLIDLAYWALKLNYPLTIESEGPAADSVACPPWQQVTWEHPARAGNDFLNIPTKVIWYHGPEGMKRRSDYLQPMVGSDTEINKWGIGVAFVGEKGVLVADYDKHLLSPSASYKEYVKPAESIPASLGHYVEWLKACKTDKQTLCNFDYSGKLIEHNLLGNVAHRVGKKLVWDAEAFKVTNTNEADKYLSKDYREGWGIKKS